MYQLGSRIMVLDFEFCITRGNEEWACIRGKFGRVGSTRQVMKDFVLNFFIRLFLHQKEAGEIQSTARPSCLLQSYLYQTWRSSNYFSSSKTLYKLPIWGRISTTNSSPPCRVSLGLRPQPMPAGVPVILQNSRSD